MTKKTYNEIVKQARVCYKNVEKDQKTGMSSNWAYYFAKALLNPKKDVTVIKIARADKPTQSYISTTLNKSQYLRLAKDFTKQVETKNKLPNYTAYKNYKLYAHILTIFFARCLISYEKYGGYRDEKTLTKKWFEKPVETTNEVYNYFVKVFGKFDNTIDGALSKIDGRGYDGYSDDRYSNKTSIDRMKSGSGINCTDSCHVFYNIMKQLIALGKYKKVECLHVRCSSGVGHVRLRITMNDGTRILRDPASVLDGNGITSNWCTSNYELWAIDPSWFLENLNK